MSGSRITINDVAKAAGVTCGTVDRVLHNRGEVAQATREKVLKVIEKLGYKPNVYASLLAKNVAHNIAVIMPSFNAGDFWELVNDGFDQAREYAGRFSVTITMYYYNQYDIDSFRKQCNQVVKEGHSGVIIAPMFLDETLRFSVKLSEEGIPYVIFNTSAGTDSHLAYYGLPMYESGRCCADMLMSMSDTGQKDRIYLVKILRDAKKLSDPSADKRRGFLDYMEDYYPDTEIINVVVNPNSPKDVTETFAKAFSGAEGRLNIVTLNSRIYLVADYLRSQGLKGFNVVGYDVLERNIEALKKGYVRMLIGQHSDKQAIGAVTALTDYLVIGKSPKIRDNYMSIDLLTKNNYTFYRTV